MMTPYVNVKKFIKEGAKDSGKLAFHQNIY